MPGREQHRGEGVGFIRFHELPQHAVKAVVRRSSTRAKALRSNSLWYGTSVARSGIRQPSK